MRLIRHLYKSCSRNMSPVRYALILCLIFHKPICSMDVKSWIDSSGYEVRLDPYIGSLPVTLANTGALDPLMHLTQILPLKISSLNGKSYVVYPAYPMHRMETDYRFTVLLKSHNLIFERLRDLGSWFLRQRLSWRIENEVIMLQATQAKELGLKQHLNAHKVLMETLLKGLPKPELAIDLSLSDWMNWQLEVTEAGFVGPLPSLRPYAHRPNPMKF